jgi:hypothetical protein
MGTEHFFRKKRGMKTMIETELERQNKMANKGIPIITMPERRSWITQADWIGFIVGMFLLVAIFVFLYIDGA